MDAGETVVDGKAWLCARHTLAGYAGRDSVGDLLSDRDQVTLGGQGCRQTLKGGTLITSALSCLQS